MGRVHRNLHNLVGGVEVAATIYEYVVSRRPKGSLEFSSISTVDQRGNPLKMYSTPLIYKSLENPIPLVDTAEVSSAKAEATNFNPVISPHRRS